MRPLYRFLRAVLFGLLSAVAEKNPSKVAAVDAPFVFSMSRVIVAAFAYGMWSQMRGAGIAGWPEATLCIALVYAGPVLEALSKVDPATVLAFGSELLRRFGEGEARKVASVYNKGAEPDARADDERGEAR